HNLPGSDGQRPSFWPGRLKARDALRCHAHGILAVVPRAYDVDVDLRLLVARGDFDTSGAVCDRNCDVLVSRAACQPDRGCHRPTRSAVMAEDCGEYAVPGGRIVDDLSGEGDRV